MENTINLALQLLPKSGTKEVYSLIDRGIEVIMESGLNYRICPFETVIEGEYEEVMALVKKTQEVCFEEGAEELLVNIKIQVRKDQDVTIEEKTGKYE